MCSACAQKEILHTHTHTQAVAVVGSRPHGVGRQPAFQNEAQSDHSEMNALEDGQTATSNAQRVRGKQRWIQTVVFGMRPLKKKEEKSLEGQQFGKDFEGKSVLRRKAEKTTRLAAKTKL